MGRGLVLAVAIALAAGPALAADRGWVRGAPLNLRSGSGTEFRIVGVLRPGDPVEILERGERWTRVARVEDGQEGWIAAGYLSPEAPAAERAAELQAALARAQAELERLRSETSALRSANETFTDADAEQIETIDALRQENAKLRVGERWAEWITGALIFSSGLVAGFLVTRLGGRRASRRLRL